MFGACKATIPARDLFAYVSKQVIGASSTRLIERPNRVVYRLGT